ncbi:MAG TPA: flavodoxin domain-containing protein, partial [Flavitalea sp.]|nr:flavodoxin domain-containing protein [Flavitalea sp.]
MKGIIIYKSKYGATRQYAEMLSHRLDLGLIDADQVTAEMITKYDYLLIGGSIYIGKFILKEFLKKHSGILQTKKMFVFFVSAASPDEEVHNN